MKIPSERTRRTMEAAAELRAGGLSWAAIAEKLGRVANVLERWTRYYAEEWQRLLGEAEEALRRQCNGESRAALRKLLRDEDKDVALGAADKLGRLCRDGKAAERPADPRAHLANLYAHLEEMSDEEFEEELADFVASQTNHRAPEGGDTEKNP